MKRTRLTNLIVAILVAGLLVGSSCKRKDKTEKTKITSATTTEATTTASESETTETTTESTTAEATTTTTEAPSETTEPSETSAPTETPAPTATPTPSPVPATPTPSPVPATPTPIPTETPTPVPDTPTPTEAPEDTPTPIPTDTPTPVPDTPTPTEVPENRDPGLRKGTAISAAKAAVQDNCGWKDGFEFNDAVMSNQQARAQYCADTNTSYGHNNIPGTFVLLESASTFHGYIFEDGSQLYRWTDDDGIQHKYDDFYTCVYECAAYDVTQHTEKLASGDLAIYFGVGFAGTSWTDDDGVIYYTYYLYIGGGNDYNRADGLF